MINNPFLGVLKKYQPFRRNEDGNIFIDILIKHVNHGGVQTFLDSFSTKLGIDNVKPLFEFPVRWEKLVINTSDYVHPAYKVTFEEADFVAELQKIGITQKFVDDGEVFEYSLHFFKEASSDALDRVIAESYLNYKEENPDGKRVVVEFEVNLELLEHIEQTVADANDEIF